MRFAGSAPSSTPTCLRSRTTSPRSRSIRAVSARGSASCLPAATAAGTIRRWKTRCSSAATRPQIASQLSQRPESPHVPPSEPAPTSRSSFPSTTRRRSSTRRSSICASGSTPLGWTLRDHPRRERLARPHRRDRAGARRDKYPRGARRSSPRRAELRQGAEAGHPRGARRRSSSATRSTSATSTSTAARVELLETGEADLVDRLAS